MSWSRWLLALPLAYLALFFLYPLVAILARSLGDDGGFSLGPFASVLGDRYYLGRVWFTVWQATVSTLLSLAIGLPVAYLFARFEFPGKGLLKAVSTVPFVMPTIVVAMAFVALFGPKGLLNTVTMDLFGLDAPRSG